MLERGVDPARPPAERATGRAARIDIRTAFHLATASGGNALDLPVGRFAVGYQFDALADTQAERGTIRLFDEADAGSVLDKILYTASTANITTVWVGGRGV